MGWRISYAVLTLLVALNAPAYATDYTVAWDPQSVFSADLDGDGNNDLVTANQSSTQVDPRGTVSVLLNKGDGTFAAKVDYGVGHAPRSVFIVDIDGDGDNDLAVANGVSNTVSVLLNNGNGTFVPKVDYAVGSNPSSVFSVDLDGDGHNDLAVANRTSGTVSVLLNNGDGTFAAKVDYDAGSDPISVFSADLDGDGDNDLVVANQGTALRTVFGTLVMSVVSVLMNNGDRTFAPKVDYDAGEGLRSVFSADLDGDGDNDLAVANGGFSTSPGNTVSVLLNNGDGTFAPKVEYGVGSRPWSLFSADLDGDGDNDLAVANRDGNSVSVLLNNGDGTFAPKVDYFVGHLPLSVFGADLDGDGDNDLATAIGRSTTVSVLLISIIGNSNLSGKVTDEQGRPVSGVKIQAGRVSAITGVDGTYTMLLSLGRYYIQVTPPLGSDLLRPASTEVDVEEDVTLDITLTSGYLLSGRVTDLEGKGIADVFVLAYSPTRFEYTYTSSDGSYRIRLLSGTYSLSINVPSGSEFAKPSMEDIELTEDMSLDIILEPGFLLSGRVTDPEGKGIADVSVDAHSPTGSGYTRTSSDGSYRIRLLPGTYSLSINVSSDEFPKPEMIEGIEVTEDTSLDIVLESGFLLSGRVTDPEGKGVADVSVYADSPTSFEYTQTSSDGSYRIRLLPGTYDLLVLAPVEDLLVFALVGRKLADVEVSADQTLDIVLPSPESTFTLSGTVTDKEARGIAGLLIEAYDPATGNYALVGAQRDGTYSMKLALGTYDLTVLPPSGSGLSKGEIKEVQITGDTVRHIVVGPGTVTAVEGEEMRLLPRTFSLSQNYPNPFNASTVIEYALPRSSRVNILMYNTLGQRVRVLVDEVQTDGYYKVLWDGKDDTGHAVATGMYLYRLEADGFVKTRKLILMR